MLSKIYGGFVSAKGSAEALRRLCGGSAEALRRLCGGSADALFPMQSVFLEMRSPWKTTTVNYLHVIFYQQTQTWDLRNFGAKHRTKEPAMYLFQSLKRSKTNRKRTENDQTPTENDRKPTENEPETIENRAENNRKRRRNEAFEFDSNCQAP